MYNITRSNGTTQTIADGVLDNSKCSVTLPGKGVFAYGQAYANTIVNMLENFAGPTAPAKAIPGQLWYNSTTGTLMINKSLNDTTPNWQPNGFMGSEGNPLASAFISSIGSVTTPVNNIYGGTFHGTSVAAKYADLAENYEADVKYQPGTLVKFGGSAEITIADRDSSVFGVVSSNPAYLMNQSESENVLPVALIGRVPVRVVGEISKFDYVVLHPSLSGVGVASKSPVGAIGRALHGNSDQNEKLVECFVKAGI